ncbi:40S ribosomal protein S19-1 [Linum grandiflorum]
MAAAGDVIKAGTVKDVSPHEFVKAYAAHLKRSGKVVFIHFYGSGSGMWINLIVPWIELPTWTDIVKTGKLKELAPYDPDWIYGGSKRNGSRPPHFCKSSGAVARHILQQLEAVNIVEVVPTGGRRITSNGQRDLDQVAGRIVVVAP